MTRAAGALLVAALAAASPASAQSCTDGRVTTPEGYCCWPGQTWDDAHQRCSGPPRCPEPLAAIGPTCVGRDAAVAEVAPPRPRMVHAMETVDYGSGVVRAQSAARPASTTPPEPRSAPARPEPAAPTGEMGTGWASAGQTPPAGAVNPHVERRSAEDLQIAGGVLAGVGYLGAVGIALVAFTRGGIFNGDDYDRSCHSAIGGTLLIPALGGLLTPAPAEACRVPQYRNAGGVGFRVGDGSRIVSEPGWIGLGLVSSAVQLVGLTLVLVGSLDSTEVTVLDGPSATLTLAPQLGATNGLQVTLSFL